MSQEFENLVAQGVHLQRELNVLQDWRASAKCWIDHCLALGNSDPQKLGAARAKFEEGREVFAKTRGVLEHLVRTFTNGRFPRPGKVDSMAAVLRAAGAEEAAEELAELGMSRWELFGLAAEAAAERYPSAFGDVDDAAACQSRAMQLKLKRGVLLEKINTAWEQDDLSIHEIRSDGAALITFRLAMPYLRPNGIAASAWSITWQPDRMTAPGRPSFAGRV